MASGATDRPGRPVPVIGRHAILEELLAQLQRSRDGDGRLVLLAGEGGIGKTTVLRAVADLARTLGFRVVEGRSLPAELPEPFRLVRALLRSAQADGAAGDVVPRPVPSLPMLLGPYEPDAPSDVARATGLADASRASREADRLLDHLANPVERVEANRRALFGQIGEFFLHLAADRPLLIALDDLHFADDSSLEFLVDFVPTLAPARLCAVGTVAPPPEAPERTRAALGSLAASPLVGTSRIPPMSEPELAELARWLLRGRDPGRDAVMRWFTQTEGNPLFAEYLVRATTGLRAGPADGAAVQDLGELLRERIRGLDEPDRRLLVHGAILGKEFDFATLSVAAGGEEERLSESLDRLVHLGLLREKGGEVYEFVSERARADVYAQLTETRRRLLHRKVGRALEARATEDAGTTFELARQFYLGRDDDRAVEYNRRAADLAAQAFAFDAAVTHLERALESLRRREPRDLGLEVLLLIELGRYLDELGDLKRSEEVLLDAVARARTDPEGEVERALALLGLAQTRSDLTQYPSARDLAREAFGILERRGHLRGLLAAHRVLGVASWRLGLLDDAREHQRRELALAEEVGSPVDLGHALIDLANTLTLQAPDRGAEARALYERAAELFRASGDHSAHARVLMNLALLQHYDRRPDDALATMEAALEAARRSRSRIWIGYCALNLAQFLAERRALDAARERLTEARRSLEPLGDRLAEQQLTMIDGIVAVEAGDPDGAERAYAEALRLARSLDLTAEAAEMEFRFADLEARRGRPERARERLAAARAAGIDRLRADLLPRVAELEAHLAPAPLPQP